LKKALQEQNLILQNGQLVGWGKADLKNLLKSANEAEVSEQIRRRGTYKQVADMVAYEWLERLAIEGKSKQLINDLNKPISHIEYRRALMLSKSGEVSWQQVAIENDDLRHPQLKVIYIVSHLLAIGALENLKRCKLEDCRKFFIGPSNRTWCSKSCGSLYRVRQKRKVDKKRIAYLE
jgi:hypothetical protein